MFFHKLTHTNAHTQGAVENLECPVGGKKAEKPPCRHYPVFWYYFWSFVRLKYLCIRMTKILQQLFCIHIVYLPFCMLLIQLLGLVNS